VFLKYIGAGVDVLEFRIEDKLIKDFGSFFGKSQDVGLGSIREAAL